LALEGLNVYLLCPLARLVNASAALFVVYIWDGTLVFLRTSHVHVLGYPCILGVWRSNTIFLCCCRFDLL
jgi:hypothetical protein